jgi:hypothetical protein
VDTREIEPQYPAEIRIWQSNYHPFNLTHPPHAFAGVTDIYSQAVGYPPLLQLSDSSTRILPLFPKNRPQTPHYPAMRRTEPIGALGEAVIIPPPPEILVQIENDPVNRPAAVAIGQFPHPVLESLYRSRMNADTRVLSLAYETEADCDSKQVEERYSTFFHLPANLAAQQQPIGELTLLLAGLLGQSLSFILAPNCYLIFWLRFYSHPSGYRLNTLYSFPSSSRSACTCNFSQEQFLIPWHT